MWPELKLIQCKLHHSKSQVSFKQGNQYIANTLATYLVAKCAKNGARG